MALEKSPSAMLEISLTQSLLVRQPQGFLPHDFKHPQTTPRTEQYIHHWQAIINRTSQRPDRDIMGWDSPLHYVHRLNPKQFKARRPTLGLYFILRMVLFVHSGELSPLWFQLLPHRQKRKRIRKILYLQARIDQSFPLCSYCLLLINKPILLRDVLPRYQPPLRSLFSDGISACGDVLLHLLFNVFMLRPSHCINAVEIHHCQHRFSLLSFWMLLSGYLGSLQNSGPIQYASVINPLYLTTMIISGQIPLAFSFPIAIAGALTGLFLTWKFFRIQPIWSRY